MDIYVLKAINFFDLNLLNQLMKLLDPEKQKRINKIRNVDKAFQVLMADLLIRYILITQFNVLMNQIKFCKNEFNKPYLPPTFNFVAHFNISHSCNRVICGVDEFPIGVDIEYIKETDFLNNVSMYFSKEEYQDLLKINKEQRILYYYDLLTIKESYLKRIGKGFSVKLNSFSVKFDKNINEFYIKDFLSNIIKENFIKQLNFLNPNYRISVCCSHEFEPKVTLLSAEDIINFFKGKIRFKNIGIQEG